MNHTIILGEHCFGRIVSIDNINLIESDYNDSKINEDLLELIFSWLKDSINKFQKDELEHLVDMLHYNGNQLYYKFNFTDEELKKLDDLSYGEFICDKINYDTNIIFEEIFNSRYKLDLIDWRYLIEYIVLNSNSVLISGENESCEQCGNINYSSTYILEINEEN